MTNLCTYGIPPFSVALVHGGPGAAGDMAPVAHELASLCGVLEPYQTEATVEGQVCELADTLREAAVPPVVLTGHSWGAWLAVFTAAKYPHLVRKLILIGSGPFEDRYAMGIMDTRLMRLTPDERKEARSLSVLLADPLAVNDPGAFSRFGALMEKADVYDPIPATIKTPLVFHPDIFHTIWPEAARLRRSGELLDAARRVRCPVVAIHGDYDPHPAEGVREPLAAVLSDVRFILLEKCGHKPWVERWAREAFYDVLKDEIRG